MRAPNKDYRSVNDLVKELNLLDEQMLPKKVRKPLLHSIQARMNPFIDFHDYLIYFDGDSEDYNFSIIILSGDHLITLVCNHDLHVICNKYWLKNIDNIRYTFSVDSSISKAAYLIATNRDSFAFVYNKNTPQASEVELFFKTLECYLDTIHSK